MPRLLNGIAMAAAIALGVGVLNCFLITMIPVYEQIWVVITRPLFIASGIFFVFEDVPQGFRDALWYNPLFHATGEVRRGLYPTYAGDYVSSPFVYGVAAALTLLGLFLLYFFQDRVLDR